MTELLKGIAAQAGSLGLFGATIAFVWSIVQFLLQRSRESREKQFETYHRLVKEPRIPSGDLAPCSAGRSWSSSGPRARGEGRSELRDGNECIAAEKPRDRYYAGPRR